MASINELELTRAIDRTLVAHGKVPPGEARLVARMVLGYFGLDDTVLDNKLSSEDRDRFYQLEEEGLLTSEEEDATVSRGKTWRIHYWLLKKARIRDVGQSGDTPHSVDEGEVYKSVDESDWRRKGEATSARR
ncbi:MAG: DUF6015 family protein [Thermoplasmata archaeon]